MKINGKSFSKVILITFARFTPAWSNLADVSHIMCDIRNGKVYNSGAIIKGFFPFSIT